MSDNLRERRAKLIHDAGEILTKAANEKRELTEEEDGKWNALVADSDVLLHQIERQEKQSSLEAGLAVAQPRKTVSGLSNPEEITAEMRYRALRAWAGHGVPQFRAEPRDLEAAERCGINPAQAAIAIMPPALRALSVGTTTAGGNIVPDEMMQTFFEAQKAFGPMRQVATILSTETGADLPIGLMDDTGETGALVAEAAAMATTSDPTIEQTVLKGYMYTSNIVLVSLQLIQDAWINLPAWLGEALGRRLARVHNTHFSTGDGSSKPNGIVPKSTLGKTAAATNAITYGETVDVIHALDPAYRNAPSCAWQGADTTIAALRKLLDSDNRPIWSVSAQAGVPDNYLGYPMLVNNDMDAIAATKKVLIFGELARYVVRDAGEVVFTRLNELYAATGQVGFVALQRSDGGLPDTTAVKHLLTAT